MPSFFPWWVVVTHFRGIFFLLLMARPGIEVLSAFPKFYWHDDCPSRAAVSALAWVYRLCRTGKPGYER